MNRKVGPIVATFTMLIAMMAGQAEAEARRKVTLEASIPFEFVVGNRAYPAGRYTFEMATGTPKSTDRSGVLIVRSRERKLYTAIATGVSTDQNPHDGHKLIFVRDGNRVLLSKVWRQGNVAGLSVPTVGGPNRSHRSRPAAETGGLYLGGSTQQGKRIIKVSGGGPSTPTPAQIRHRMLESRASQAALKLLSACLLLERQ